MEFALVETLIKNWLTIPMPKGIDFLNTAHEQLKAWQQDRHQQISIVLGITPSQFSQITGLEAQTAFDALAMPEPAVSSQDSGMNPIANPMTPEQVST